MWNDNIIGNRYLCDVRVSVHSFFTESLKLKRERFLALLSLSCQLCFSLFLCLKFHEIQSNSVKCNVKEECLY